MQRRRPSRPTRANARCARGGACPAPPNAASRVRARDALAVPQRLQDVRGPRPRARRHAPGLPGLAAVLGGGEAAGQRGARGARRRLPRRPAALRVRLPGAGEGRQEVGAGEGEALLRGRGEGDEGHEAGVAGQGRHGHQRRPEGEHRPVGEEGLEVRLQALPLLQELPVAVRPLFGDQPLRLLQVGGQPRHLLRIVGAMEEGVVGGPRA